MSLANVQKYSMDELWGGKSTADKRIESPEASKEKRRLMYCLKLKIGGYVAVGMNNELMEVYNKEFAEIFYTIQEAARFCRLNWIDAEVVPWDNR